MVVCLDTIERGNPDLNVFVYIDAEHALGAARAVDAVVHDRRVGELGPLAGVPFGVKDLEDCAGMPTTRGSRWFADGPAKTADSIHVGRLRAAGAIPVGKTATPEFGAWAYTASPLLGVTRNPWNLSCTPGGSSGGTAAAVASAMVPFGTASDGGGSIRTPASFTGLVGLKSTYGRIPTLGDTHLAQNAVVGCLTTTVADTALLLDVMAGPDARDRTCLPAPTGSYLDALDAVELPRCRVAWSLDLGFATIDHEVGVLCEQAAQAFVRATGASLVDRPIQLEDYIRTYAFVEGVDKFVGVERDLWENRLDELDPLSAPGWTRLSVKTLPWLRRWSATVGSSSPTLRPSSTTSTSSLPRCLRCHLLPRRDRCPPTSTAPTYTAACRSCSRCSPTSSTCPPLACPLVWPQTGSRWASRSSDRAFVRTWSWPPPHDTSRHGPGPAIPLAHHLHQQADARTKPHNSRVLRVRT